MTRVYAKWPVYMHILEELQLKEHMDTWSVKWKRIKKQQSAEWSLLDMDDRDQLTLNHLKKM